MLNKSDEELKAGKVVAKTMEELEAMENQNYEYFIYRYRLGTIHRMARAGQKDHKANHQLLKSIDRDGALQGIGKPELMRHDKSGLYSRRIDEVNRLVYELNDNQIIVKSCKKYSNQKIINEWIDKIIVTISELSKECDADPQA